MAVLTGQPAEARPTLPVLFSAMNPEPTGHRRLASADPDVPMTIEYGYLSTAAVGPRCAPGPHRAGPGVVDRLRRRHRRPAGSRPPHGDRRHRARPVDPEPVGHLAAHLWYRTDGLAGRSGHRGGPVRPGARHRRPAGRGHLDPGRAAPRPGQHRGADRRDGRRRATPRLTPVAASILAGLAIRAGRSQREPVTEHDRPALPAAAAVVLAAGSGTRLGAERNKVFLPLAGR